MLFKIEVFSHYTAQGASGKRIRRSYRGAVKAARVMASANFMERTEITNLDTGKKWVTYWPRFSTNPDAMVVG